MQKIVQEKSLQKKPDFVAIKRNSKQIIVSNLRSGDLVKVKAEFLPLIFHYGIVFRKGDEYMIYHNDPSKKNKEGGNVVMEKMDTWLIGKEIVEVTSTSLDTHDIENIVMQLKRNSYDLVHFNCEHFVNLIKSKKAYSNQLRNFTLLSAAIITAYIIIKRK